MHRAALALGLALLTTGALILASPAGPAAAATVAVDASDFWFCDSSYQNGVCEITVSPGDTVHWDFLAGVHTVTHCGSDCDNPTGSPLFNSGPVGAGGSYEYTFNDIGRFLYYCQLHPFSMRGIINVGGVGGVSQIDQVDLTAANDAESASDNHYDLIAAGAATALALSLGFVSVAWYARRRWFS